MSLADMWMYPVAIAAGSHIDTTPENQDRHISQQLHEYDSDYNK